ncbi:MAG: hypothetical protein KH282_01810 [Clostridiales bacterium]|nr:hypothetical protein [Clostridiales bacterium]
MLSKSELTAYKNTDICACDLNILTDISRVAIDCHRSLFERAEQYFATVKNPYVFRVGDIGVKINCTGTKDLTQSIIDLAGRN